MNSHNKLRECEERIARMRRAVLRALVGRLKPHLRPCGYSNVSIFIMKNREPRVVRRAKVATCILGFYQDGVVTAAEGHALLTTAYHELPLEDLIALSRFFDKHIKEME